MIQFALALHILTTKSQGNYFPHGIYASGRNCIPQIVFSCTALAYGEFLVVAVV